LRALAASSFGCTCFICSVTDAQCVTINAFLWVYVVKRNDTEDQVLELLKT